MTLDVPFAAAAYLYEIHDPDHPCGIPSVPLTLEGLVEANEDGFSEEDVAALAALPVGGIYSIGGGAAVRFDIKRLPDEARPFDAVASEMSFPPSAGER